MFIDHHGYYGSTSGSFDSNTELTYGSDFCLVIDQENGSSRCGLLVRINNLWPKPQLRQTGWLSPFIGEAFGNIKVVYTAGFTPDTLPTDLRFACNTLVARMRYIMPLGMSIGSESYEERSIGMIEDKRNYLMSFVAPVLVQYRNWNLF